jgi:uncharacterized protein YbaR (Trm112 family)
MTTKAAWTIELIATCPKCDRDIDLLEQATEAGLAIGEHETDRTKDAMVWCPLCGHDFPVTLEY